LNIYPFRSELEPEPESPTCTELRAVVVPVTSPAAERAAKAAAKVVAAEAARFHGAGAA